MDSNTAPKPKEMPKPQADLTNKTNAQSAAPKSVGLEIGDNIKKEKEVKEEVPIPISEPIKKINYDVPAEQFDPSNWAIGPNSGNAGANKNTTTTSQGAALDDDVQARYDLLVKSGATAISSDMLFGREEQTRQQQQQSQGGRWSQPAVAETLQAMGERTQAAIANARNSMGSKQTI